MNNLVENFEKLGVFYLGRRYDLSRSGPSEELMLYDARDLLTHAVCIGMTGSGKTGLCLGLIEEAAIDGVPVIAIDPKGDISNLLLTFPELCAESLLPWINESESRRAGLSPEEFARQQAEQWLTGLKQSHQGVERIKRLRDAVDLAVYTPGSRAGIPVSILGSLFAPSHEVLEDPEAYREKINAAVGPLLALVKIEADPVMSREYIFLSNIIDQAWRAGKQLTLAELIHAIQQPEVRQIGAMDLESFFPKKERFELALKFNNLIAAPGFQAWLEGEPLSIDRFLYTATGKPRVSILSIAHLNDSERMFFVTLLLSQLVSWMRAQSGINSLRAILYMDEIFGYFPPVANPPSKLPLLTLLKQARAFGIGIVLASQNPVDLDYKGLANTGTWFIGRLQTERDKLRVLEGLEGACAESGSHFDKQAMERLLAGLGRRVFLVNNVRTNSQDVFETRFTLSYLRGPLDKSQIKKLMNSEAMRTIATPGAAASGTCGQRDVQKVGAEPSIKDDKLQKRIGRCDETSSVMPSLPPSVPIGFLSVKQEQSKGTIIYKPLLLATATVRFCDTKMKLDHTAHKAYLVTVQDNPQSISWSDAQEQKLAADRIQKQPPVPGNFIPPAAPMAEPANYKVWKREFIDWLSFTQKFYLLRSPSTGELSKAGESERDFRIRLNGRAAEARDQAMQGLRAKYSPKVTNLQDRIMLAEQRLQKQQEDVKEAELKAAISVGATILGAFTGRRMISRASVDRASSAARGAARAQREKQDVQGAEQSLDRLRQRFTELEEQFAQELSKLKAKYDVASEQLETVSISPKRSAISVTTLCLAWAPFRQENDSLIVPAW